MKTNLKLFAVLLGTFSLGMIGGCSSSDKKTDETPVAMTEEHYPQAVTTDAPKYDNDYNNDGVTTTYSSANLGTASSGMGR